MLAQPRLRYRRTDNVHQIERVGLLVYNRFYRLAQTIAVRTLGAPNKNRRCPRDEKLCAFAIACSLERRLP